MSKNQANILLLSFLVLIAIFGYLNLSIKSEFKEKREKFITFEKSAKEIYLLKRLQKNQRAVISSLSSIKKPTVREKSNVKIYTFENLNLEKLQRLIKRIQGSFLPVKKLEIKNDMTNHATVILEVTK